MHGRDGRQTREVRAETLRELRELEHDIKGLGDASVIPAPNAAERAPFVWNSMPMQQGNHARQGVGHPLVGVGKVRVFLQ